MRINCLLIEMKPVCSTGDEIRPSLLLLGNSSVLADVISGIEANSIASAESLSAEKFLSVGIRSAIISVGIKANSTVSLVVTATSSSALSVASSRVVIVIVVVIVGRCWWIHSRGLWSVLGGWNWDRIWDDGSVSSLLVDSDVIDEHLGLGPSSGKSLVDCVGLSSKESSSDGEIEDHEESLVERLSDVVVWIGSSSSVEVSDQILSVIDSSVYRPLDLVSGPFELEEVEVITEIKVEGSWSRSGVHIVGPVRFESKA